MVALKLLTLNIFIQVIVLVSKISPATALISGRVVKGLRAKVGQFPWHASLSVKMKGEENDTFLCGGSLIRSDWVLTAAHCIHGAEKIIVKLGSINSDKFKVQVVAKAFFYRDDVELRILKNDIALVQLPEPVPMMKQIQTIEILPESLESKFVPGLNGTVCGFGKRTNFKERYPNVLLWLRVRIISNENCWVTFHEVLITDQKFCAVAKNPRQNICDGDSGGGLVVQIGKKKYLAGVALFGAKKQCTGTPAGYQKTTPYLDWINSKITPQN